MPTTAVDYITLDAYLLSVTEKGVQLETPYGTNWFPRSRIHGADDRELEGIDVGDVISIRIEAWLIDKLRKGE